MHVGRSGGGATVGACVGEVVTGAVVGCVEGGPGVGSESAAGRAYAKADTLDVGEAGWAW